VVVEAQAAIASASDTTEDAKSWLDLFDFFHSEQIGQMGEKIFNILASPKQILNRVIRLL
jgi:hypothetical protein